MAKIFTLVPQYELREISWSFVRALIKLDLHDARLRRDDLKRAVNKSMWSS
jgi:hypothetical protein